MNNQEAVYILINSVAKEILHCIETHDYRLRDFGICYHMRKALYSRCDIRMTVMAGTLSELFTSWPLHVSADYPVPASRSDVELPTDVSARFAELAFEDAREEEMWFEGEYAKLRKELVEHIINETNHILGIS